MHLRPFEIGLIAFFVLAALAGLLGLRMYEGGSEEANVYGERVVVWGTFHQSSMDRLFDELKKTDEAFSAVSYEQRDVRSLTNDLVNAIAEGRAPDLVILPHTLLVELRPKLSAQAYAGIDERTFRDRYIDGASIFRLSDGTYALPFAVDPLMLYWNRDMLASARFAEPPKTWEQLVATYVPGLTSFDATGRVAQSAIGLGEHINVNNARSILAMLIFQAGGTIVEEAAGKYRITLAGPQLRMTASALSFYTQFARPGSGAYTWNRSLALDRSAFTSGSLALYFGFASEVDDIALENPNINFDMAVVPQGQGVTARRSIGQFYGFVMPKTTQNRNPNGAFAVAAKLASGTVAPLVARELDVMPTSRSYFSTPVAGVYEPLVRESSLIARGWLDPSPRETESIMRAMIDDTSSGRKDIDAVISEAVTSLEALFRK